MSASSDISSFIAGLGQAQGKAIAAAKRGIQEAAMMVLAKSQYYAPKATGALAASATWGEVVLSGDVFSIELGYNTDYAAAVHEVIVSTGGKPVHHAPPTRAKFLEIAIRELQPSIAPHVQKRIEESMR